MIKLLFSGKQILIVSLVFILIVNTTNLTFPNAVDEKTIKDLVNTVDATESNDKKVCENYNGKWKSIGGGDRGCTFENDDDAERYGFRPGFSLDSTSGDAEYGIEDFVTYDNEGNKIYPNTETDSSKQQQDEIAAYEDDSSNDEESDDNEVPIEDPINLLYDDEIEREDVEKYCDASEDYKKHPKQCDKLYNLVEKFEDEHQETTTNED